MSAIHVVLASNSPRRTQLLAEKGVTHEVFAADVDETLLPELAADPQRACMTLAQRKAQGAVESYFADHPVTGAFAFIGSDTMVVQDGQIFGKPHDAQDAFSMLERLSGKTHQVMTAVCICMVTASDQSAPQTDFHTFIDISNVTFLPLSSADINDYLACGESWDKAGAYAVQGQGARLIERVEGNLDTVIGLPAGRLVSEYGTLLGL